MVKQTKENFWLQFSVCSVLKTEINVVSHSPLLKDVKRRGKFLSEGCTQSNIDHCMAELATWDTFFVRGCVSVC
jgi:hypothetical protein